MACPPVYSGAAFLRSTIAYVDCQAQAIGAFGFQALSTPNSIGGAVLTGMLVLFVALFGYRLLLGYPADGRDVLSAVIKIGIVLTLATSWGTVRTLVYNTVLFGPAEIAGAVTGASDLATPYAMMDRLENVDSGIMALTAAGTGRESLEQNPAAGAVTPLGDPAQQLAAANAFKSQAVSDNVGMGVSRVAFLAGTLAPLVALRLAAGLLVALAPVVAVLLLFQNFEAIFFGWVRALVAVALGSMGLIVSLSVQLALIEPWLADAIGRRNARILTPAAPTELLVMTVLFAIVAFALLYLFGRLAFNSGAIVNTVGRIAQLVREHSHRVDIQSRPAAGQAPAPQPRAAQIADRLTTIYRGERRLPHDESSSQERHVTSASGMRDSPEARHTIASAAPVPLGSTYRRTRQSSALASSRDRRL